MCAHACVRMFLCVLVPVYVYNRFSCAIALGSLTIDDVKNKCMLHTVSKAWCLGRAVRRGQLAKTDPVNAVTTSVNGRLIISGKVWIIFIGTY